MYKDSVLTGLLAHVCLHGFAGIRTFEDVLHSGKPIKMGATRAGSNTVDLPLT